MLVEPLSRELEAHGCAVSGTALYQVEVIWIDAPRPVHRTARREVQQRVVVLRDLHRIRNERACLMHSIRIGMPCRVQGNPGPNCPDHEAQNLETEPDVMENPLSPIVSPAWSSTQPRAHEPNPTASTTTKNMPGLPVVLAEEQNPVTYQSRPSGCLIHQRSPGRRRSRRR